jgi:outer membrane protein assembly factor BamB
VSLRLRIVFLALLLSACAKDESLPDVRTSTGLSVDGAHLIPFDGAPDLISQTREIDSTLSPGGWSTAPLPLAAPFGYACGTRSGKIFVFSPHDSLVSTIDVGDGVVIDQLLTDGKSIVVIGLNGAITSSTPDGKRLWSMSVGAFVSANALIVAGKLIVAVDKRIIAIDYVSGKQLWDRSHTLQVHSLAFDVANNTLVAALTANASDATDSIALFSSDGSSKGAIALPQTRFTSNVAICGTEDDRVLAFGALGGVDGNHRRATANLLKLDDGKVLWSHAVPFIVTSIAANETAVFAAGFRMLENEVVSGISGFALEDTTTLWTRRFTVPLSAPIAASSGNIYFSLAFESEAIVDTRGLLYTLNAGDGKTMSERPVEGAAHGFFPGMPMPDEQGRLLLADRDKLVIYALDRSTLRRVF